MQRGFDDDNDDDGDHSDEGDDNGDSDGEESDSSMLYFIRTLRDTLIVL